MKELRGKVFWILLLLGCVTFAAVGGKYNVALFAFIYPIFFLLITRNTSRVTDFLLIALVMGIGGIIKYPNVIDAGVPYNELVAAFFSMLAILPFIADKFIYKTFTYRGSTTRKFIATLIFPCLMSCLDIVYYKMLLGSILSVSTTQLDNLPFLQISSILGQLGVTFIISWVPSILYFFVETYQGYKDKPLNKFYASVKKPLAISVIFFLLLFVFGEIRLNFTSFDGEYVKIAYGQGVEPRKDSNGEWITENINDYKNACENQIKIAAMNEAKLICFPEESFVMNDDQRDDFIQFVGTLAKQNKIYVTAGLEVADKNGVEPSDNCVVSIGPDGKLISKYTKSKLVPFVETEYYLVGNGTIQAFPMRLSHGIPSIVSVAICFEGEFCDYIDTIGPDTDILVNPSFEWTPGVENHNASLQLRAIEHGISVIEPTIMNNSSIFNPLGACVVHSSTTQLGYDQVIFVNIPSKKIDTLYVSMRYFTDYLYVPGLIAFIAFAVYRKRNHSSLDEI